MATYTFRRNPGDKYPNFIYTLSLTERSRNSSSVTFDYSLKAQICGFYRYNLWFYLLHGNTKLINIDLTSYVRKVSTPDNSFATFYNGSGTFTISGLSATATSAPLKIQTYSNNTSGQGSWINDSANYTYGEFWPSFSSGNTPPSRPSNILTGTSSITASTASKYIHSNTSTLNISWPAASDNEDNASKLKYKLDYYSPTVTDGNWWLLTWTDPGVTSGSLNVSSHAEGSEYKFRVAAQDSGGLMSSTIESNKVTKNTRPVMSGSASINGSTGGILLAHTTESVNLTWPTAKNAGASLSCYVIEVCIDDGSSSSSYSQVTTVTSTSYTYKLPRKEEGVCYRFRIYARDALNEESKDYVYTSWLTLNTKPSLSGKISTSPSGVISHSATSISLSWPSATDPNNNIRGYYVDYSKNGSSYVRLTETTSTSFKHTISPVQGDKYQYRVNVYDAFGTVSSYITSDVVTLNTAPSLSDSVKTSPSGLIFRNTEKIMVKWNAASDVDSNVSGYRVYCSVNSATETLITTTTASSYEHNVTQWNSGATFKYSVVAFDAFDALSTKRYSAVVTKSTPPTLSGSITTNPTGIFSHDSSVVSQISLTWGAGSNNITYYKVFCSVNGGAASLISTVQKGTTSLNHNITSYVQGTRLKYSVQAFDQFDDPSNIIYSAEVVKNTIPTLSGSITTSPSGIIAENATRLSISWPTANDVDNNLTGYKLYFSQDGGDYKIVTTTTAGTTSYAHTIGGTEGTKFRYQVEAYDKFNGLSSRLTSNVIEKNTLTAGSITNIEKILFNTSSINITIKKGSNTSGITPTYKLYSDNITVYNQNITGNTTLTIYKTGNAPSTPYIKWNDLINLVRNTQYIGSFTLTLETNSTTGTVKRHSISVPVNLQTEPIAPNSVIIDPANSTSVRVFNNTNYYIPNGSKTVRVKWTAGEHPLGGTFNYCVYSILEGVETLLATVNSSTTTYDYKPAKLNFETKSLKFKILIKPTDYPLTSSKNSDIVTLHYYETPSGALVDRVIRSSTSATAKVLIKPITSVPSVQISGTWVCKKVRDNSQVCNGNISNTKNIQTITCNNLTEEDTYKLIITFNDNTTWSTNQSITIDIGANTPHVFINAYGLGVGGYKANANYSTNIYGNVNIDGTIKPTSPFIAGTTDYIATPEGICIHNNTNETGWKNSLSTVLHVRYNENRQFQIECSNSGSSLSFRAGHIDNKSGTANGFSPWREIVHSGNVASMTFMSLNEDELKAKSLYTKEDRNTISNSLTEILDTIDVKLNEEIENTIGIDTQNLSTHPLYKFICKKQDKEESVKLIPLIISLIAGYKQEKQKRENLEETILLLSERISKLEKK